MIFSNEMDNAMNFGYKFEILRGYTFKPKNIFESYVEDLFKLRSKYDRTNPINLIAKLLMNSLYGRFGMEDSFPDITVFNNFKTFKAFYNEYNEDIIDFIELGDKILVKHRSENKDQQLLLCIQI